MRIVVVVRHVASTADRRSGAADRRRRGPACAPHLDEGDEVALDEARRIAWRRREVEITAVVPASGRQTLPAPIPATARRHT